VIRQRSQLTLLGFLSIAAFVTLTHCHATENAAWKYDLRPGDHLTYQYTFERAYRGDDGQSRTRAEYTSHIVVLGQHEGGISVGFQRNRASAELLAYREHGRDKLSEEIPKFRERMAKRPMHFSEAMEFNSLGEPLAYWEAARETTSKLILGLHELEALPATPPAIGDSWKGSNLLGITFKLVGRESIGDKNCARIDGADSGGAVHLRYWWCDGSGAIEKIEFDGEYSVPGGAVLETARFRLTAKKRGENINSWLKDPDVSDGALQSLLLSPWIGVKNNDLEEVLKAGDSRTRALALTYIYQTTPKDFALDKVRSLATDPNLSVKRLASRLIADEKDGGADQPPACALKEPQFPAEKIGTTVRLAKDESGTHPYMIRVPGEYRTNKKSPLLIYLSGGGGLAIDGVNTAAGTVEETDYLVLYPQAGDYWWQPGIRSRVDRLMTQVLHEFNVDTNRIYIAGFSNGGTGALDYAELWPQRFAGVASLMGAGQCNPQVAAGLKNLKQLPILLVHGERDPRIEVGCSKDTFEGLKRLSPKDEPVLHILEKREHDITLQDDGGFTLPFLANKSRNPFPKQFSAAWEDLAFPRRYWIEILEKGSGIAEVEASIQSENRIEIVAHGIKRLRLLLRHELLSPGLPLTVTVNKKRVFEGLLKPECGLLAESSSRIGDPLLGYEQALDFDIKK